MLAIPLMQLFSENEADFTELAGILGLYLEIRDDYHSLCLQEVISDLAVLGGVLSSCAESLCHESVSVTDMKPKQSRFCHYVYR